MFSLHTKYHQKVFKLLIHKSRRLRDQQSLILDDNFSSFLQVCENCDDLFEDILIFEEIPDYASSRELIEENLEKLKDSKLRTLEKINEDLLKVENFESAKLLNYILEKVER